LSVPKGMRWYLVYRSFQTEQRDFAAFRRWIMHAASGPAARGQVRTKAESKTKSSKTKSSKKDPIM
jgi:LysR family glycine cleavage system transcriptional activator